MIKWKTVCQTPFIGPVNNDPNPLAHGGITSCQVRKVFGRLQGRMVNTNNGHVEVGKPFDLSKQHYEQWLYVGEVGIGYTGHSEEN